jgi:hypothetical protein
MRPISKLLIFCPLVLISLVRPVHSSPILSFQGSGADADISFQFTPSVPLDVPGLQTSFSFDFCNTPASESCDQVNYSSPSGVLRFVGIVPAGLDVRTFEFDSYINNGVYPTLDGSPNSGQLTVTGSTDAAAVPEPSSMALAVVGFVLAVCRLLWAPGPEPIP